MQQSKLGGCPKTPEAVRKKVDSGQSPDALLEPLILRPWVRSCCALHSNQLAWSMAAVGNPRGQMSARHSCTLQTGRAAPGQLRPRSECPELPHRCPKVEWPHSTPDTGRRGAQSQPRHSIFVCMCRVGADPGPEKPPSPDRTEKTPPMRPSDYSPASGRTTLPSLKREKRNGAGSTRGVCPATRSAVRRPAPSPIPKPCPE